MQHTRAAEGQWCRMLACSARSPARFNADHANRRIIDERVEDSCSIRSAAHARHYHIRKAADRLHALLPAFAPDDALEVADDRGKRMRTDDAAKDVVR